MKREKKRQQLKNNALNKIKKLYKEHKMLDGFNQHSNLSVEEQREMIVGNIIKELEHELKEERKAKKKQFKKIAKDNENKLNKWLEKKEHLPKVIKNFEKQKNLFKSMHHLFQDSESADFVPNWIRGHIYVTDWFLHFMGSRGYTLQKTKKEGIKFRDMPDYQKILEQEKAYQEQEKFKND